MQVQRILPVVVLVLTGCLAARSRSDPFAVPGPLSEAEKLALIERRTGPVRTLYALLRMTADGPRLRGTFMAAVRWQAPDTLRLSAFRDDLLSTRSIFDLLIAGGSFRLEVAGDRPVRDRGSLRRLLRRHPDFAAIARVREGLFLPGVRDPRRGASIRTEGDRVRLDARLPSGAPVAWILDPSTLRVERAEVDGARGAMHTIRLVFARFRKVALAAGRFAFIPGVVTLDHLAAGTTVTARLVELEVDLQLAPELLR